MSSWSLPIYTSCLSASLSSSRSCRTIFSMKLSRLWNSSSMRTQRFLVSSDSTEGMSSINESASSSLDLSIPEGPLCRSGRSWIISCQVFYQKDRVLGRGKQGSDFTTGQYGFYESFGAELKRLYLISRYAGWCCLFSGSWRKKALYQGRLAYARFSEYGYVLPVPVGKWIYPVYERV